MTKTQVQACFKKWGIKNMNDVDEIMNKLVLIWFDNAGHIFLYPPDEMHQIISIDWDNELIYLIENNKGYATEVAKPFECIQQIAAKSDYKFETMSFQKEYKNKDVFYTSKDGKKVWKDQSEI